MKLLVIRHGVAEDRDEFAAAGHDDDALRPLTRHGARQMERVVKALRRVRPSIDVLASSPYVRAMQTAELVARRYAHMAITPVDALTPDHPPTDFLRWVRAQAPVPTIAAVGHEPHLGRLVTWLLTGSPSGWLALKKGGACLLELPDRPRAGSAVVRWVLTARQLRDLAR